MDWFSIRDELWISVRRDGEASSAANMRRVTISVSEVSQRVENELGDNSFMRTLLRAPAVLQESFQAVVAPLSELTARDETLVLAPTGSLYAIPIHALHVDGIPILQRNTCIYTPSLSILRQCIDRRPSAHRRPQQTSSLTFVIDPEQNLPSASDSIPGFRESFPDAQFLPHGLVSLCHVAVLPRLHVLLLLMQIFRLTQP